MKETWNHIRCPYCFKEFAHDEVHFRIAEESCQEARKKVAFNENPYEQEFYSKFIKRTEWDPKREIIWGESRGGNPPHSVESDFFTPWVDESNKSEMIVGDFQADKDGFIEKIEDKCGFKSRTRICPYCHNKLPLHYGKNPQKFISILGVSSSGKTVFLKQLLAKFENALQDGILSHVNGSFVELDLPEDDSKYLKVNQPLPDSTRTLNFKIPYFVTMTFNKDGSLTTYDFVIYDVAGETLVDLRKNNPNRFDFFAGYIKHSDGIITIIDPMQLVNDPEPKYSANEMITTLHSVFGEQVPVPTAVTISKSDLLLSSELIRNNLNPDNSYFNENSTITQDIPWDYTKKYFYDDEYKKLSAQLKRFYQNKANAFLENVNQQIANSSFFAVSALMNGVDQKLTFELVSTDKWESSHIEKYIEKFPILTKKLRHIQEDLEEQEENPKKEIIDANNIVVRKSFIFDQSDRIARNLSEILANKSKLTLKADVRDKVYDCFDEDEIIELVAESNSRKNEMFSDNNIESLSIDDLIKYICYLNEDIDEYSFKISMQGYPRSTGDLSTLRIEEPFFWLLSEMNIIDRGNLYDNSPQTRPNFLKRLLGR